MYFTVYLDLIPGNNETFGKAKLTILVKNTRVWLAENGCIFMKHKCKVVTGVHANYNSVRAVKISFVSTFCDSFFMYITSNDNYNMISLATWCNKHLKIYHQIAFENTPTVSLKSKHKVSNIPYPLQRLSTPYSYAT